ncbi:MAG TPA: LytTR family DNA-binding domain-containing protein [Steroidobacteraceae bacterium]|nr:LytTR family DNA-binding domain-containing protein [Steroidobacteraceae bacterium]
MSQNIPVLVVDDEPAARRRVRSLLRADPDFAIVGEASDGFQAAKMIAELNPSVVFLDVQIPGADGFAVLKTLVDPKQLPVIVFVTAYREYALPAFEARAFDYILKPFKRGRFFDVLSRTKAHLRTSGASAGARDGYPARQQDSELLVIKAKTRLLFLRASELRWVEAQGDYARLHFKGASHVTRATMRGLQYRLDPAQFIRIHRSTIVNIAEIGEIQPLFNGEYCVILRDRTQLTLSRRYRASLDGILRSQQRRLPRC